MPECLICGNFPFQLDYVLKNYFSWSSRLMVDVCQIDWVLDVGFKPWSIGQDVMSMVKWTV